MRTFIPKYRTLQEVLRDRKLAALGDAYVNFVYSLALSKKKGEPAGGKVDNRILSDALRKTGLRGLLPKRIDRHEQANAVEALMVYAWIQKVVTIDEAFHILESHKTITAAFCLLLQEARKKLGL